MARFESADDFPAARAVPLPANAARLDLTAGRALRRASPGDGPATTRAAGKP